MWETRYGCRSFVGKSLVKSPLARLRWGKEGMDLGKINYEFGLVLDF
jgi:hypothetical protein